MSQIITNNDQENKATDDQSAAIEPAPTKTKPVRLGDSSNKLWSLLDPNELHDPEQPLDEEEHTLEHLHEPEFKRAMIEKPWGAIPPNPGWKPKPRKVMSFYKFPRRQNPSDIAKHMLAYSKMYRKHEYEDFIEIFAYVVSRLLVNKTPVNIPGLGHFKFKLRPSRKVWDNVRKQHCYSKERFVFDFSPSRPIREAIEFDMVPPMVDYKNNPIIDWDEVVDPKLKHLFTDEQLKAIELEFKGDTLDEEDTEYTEDQEEYEQHIAKQENPK